MRQALSALITKAKASLNLPRDALKEEISIRVILDHVRAAALLLSEGVMPDNAGRGHVLRCFPCAISLYADRWR